ncbi:MAG: DUF937 domain-containing protein [Pseudomonadota bacterium]
MVNLFETLMQAQNGNALDVMARQFRLNQDQMENAVAALMPAFSQGFRRNTSDPMSVSNWMQALSGGRHANYFDDLTHAFQPAGIAEGNGILGHLFGSKDVSRAISAQAAQATGMGQEMFQQMLPVIASTLMGGMYKQMTGQMQSAPSAPTNVFGQIIEQMMQGGGMQSRASTPDPMDNPLGNALQQIFGTGQQVAPDDPADNGRVPNPLNADNNPWSKIMQDMMGGMVGTPTPEPAAEPDPAPAPQQKAPYEDLFGDMFDAGRKSQERFQDQYQRSVEQVFDQYMRGMDRVYQGN